MVCVCVCVLWEWSGSPFVPSCLQQAWQQLGPQRPWRELLRGPSCLAVKGRRRGKEGSETMYSYRDNVVIVMKGAVNEMVEGEGGIGTHSR